MAPRQLKIGVCGIGSIGARHARLLGKRGDVELAVCDPVAEHIEELRETTVCERATDSFDEMLDWELDGVILATPNRLHVAQGVAAAERGVAMLVEKPVSGTPKDGRVLAEAVRKADVPGLVGYALHYNGILCLVKELLDQGLVGTPVSFQVNLGAYLTLLVAKSRFRPDDRNKLFLDYSHEWDAIHWLLGPVARVVAACHQSGNLERTQNPNVVDALLELTSGVTGTVHIDYVQHPGRRSYTIVGDRGTIVVDALAGTAAVTLAAEDFARQYARVAHRDDAYERQLTHFAAVIRGEESPRVTLEDGLCAVDVADACIRSCESGAWEPVNVT